MNNKNIKNSKGETLDVFLENYDSNKYEKPSVTVDTLIFTMTNSKSSNIRKLPEKELKILLIKRKDHPFINHWALPGGFVDMGEDIDSAAFRELKEETNVDNVYLEQLYTWGDVGRDPRMRVISVSYMALVDSSNMQAEAGDDADEVKWFIIKGRTVVSETKLKTNAGYDIKRDIRLVLQSEDEQDKIVVILSQEEAVGKISSTKKTTIKSIETENLAFDHAKIINYAIERLQNKLEYTPIAFNLLPELFTINEVRQVYETILGRPLSPANFRRKISPMLIETDQYKGDFQFRPAQLFKYNTEWHKEF